MAAVRACSPRCRAAPALLAASGCEAAARPQAAAAPEVRPSRPAPIRPAGRSSRTGSRRRSTARAGCPTRSRARSAASGTTSTRSRPTAATSRASSGRRPAAARPAASCTSTCAATRARTKIPTCRTGGSDSRNVPCFADPGRHDLRERDHRAGLHGQPGRRRRGTACSLWRRDGTLYTLSEHVAPPLTFDQVVAYLKRELASLVLIAPARADEAHAAAARRRRRRRRSRRGRDLRARRPARRRRRRRAPGHGALRPEQHLLDGIRVVHSNGVEVLVPPLHHEIVTARVARRRADLRDAQRELERCSRRSTHDYAPSPAGLGVTVAWGLPYFDRFVPGRGRSACCRTTGGPASRCCSTRERFPSDPHDTRARAERRRDPAALRRARAHRRRVRSACARPKLFELDVDPPRLRRRRLRRRPLAAEADGAWPRRSPAPT